jgi:IS30 family transposase
MAGAVLSAHEREEIRVGLEAAESFTDIARRLDRAPSTVSQEVGRNGGRLSYCAADASVRAAKNRCRPRLTKFQRNRPMTDHVEARLVALDSPTTIAIELARAGGIGGDTVSAETIYQGVYGHGTRGLATGLGAKLHRKRSRRKLRCRAGDAPAKAGPLKEFSLIGLRPTSVEDRTEPGHWEGDLIIGAKNASAVVTLVERTSRLNLLGDLPEGHDAESVLACLIELLERVPASMRRTLTWDQGREMARHDELARAVDIGVFFAEPHHPWQRGSNENFNGLVRRYVGKGTNLSAYSQQDLDRISLRINTMPRRLHEWDSAKDRYDAAVVALTA